MAFIRVDFNRWKDESESDEDEDQFEDGLENVSNPFVSKGFNFFVTANA